MSGKSQDIDSVEHSNKTLDNNSAKQEHLNKLLLDSLPHAAMLINKNRVILAANKLATEVGAIVGGPCWHDFGHCQNLSEEHKHLIENKQELQSFETHCTFCLADKAMANQTPTNDPEVHAFDRIWDTYWIPLDDEVYLHYAIDVTERIESVKEIKRAADIVANIQVGLHIYQLEDLDDDKSLRMISVNQAATDITGVLAEDLIGETIDENFPGLRDLGIPQKYAEVVRSAKPIEIGDIHYEDPKVRPSDFSVKAFPLPDNCVGVSFEDISLQSKSKQDLIATETRQRTMIDNIEDVIGIINADGTIAYKSANIEKHFGWRPEDLVGKSAWNTVYLDDLQHIQEEFHQLLEKKNATTTLEYRYICKDGNFKWIRLTAKNLTDDKNINGVLLNYHDITERIEHSREESMLKTAIEQIPVGVALADQDLNLYFCNAAGLGIRGNAKDLTSIQKEAFANWQVLRLDGQPYAIENLPLVRAVRDGTIVHEEFIVRHADGSDHICDATALPVYDHNGEILGGIVMFPDITEKKQAELKEKELREQLSRSERMKSLGVLAGGVAHDLNNVLGPMVMLPEIVLEDIENLITENDDSKEEISESLYVIRDSAERAAIVVRDLVALSRRGQYEQFPIDINKLSCMTNDTNNIKELKRLHPSVNFKYKTSKTRLMVMGEDDHLIRVVENLIRNATEAITEEGTVSITTHKKRLKETHEGYATIPAGEYATIEVSDTGQGIPQEYQSRIFEPFFTKKKKSDRSGSGLGLSVVHGVIEDHNGFIDIDTTIDKGTTFTIYLPLINDTTATATTDTDDEEVIGGSEHVLIVDDELGQRFLAKKSMTKLGYTTTEADNGHDAVELFKKSNKPHEETPFDLVILDMIMDDGFDGIDTINEVHKLYPNQKILIASGHAEEDRIKDAQELGADWLSKPYSLSDLAKAVRRTLDS